METALTNFTLVLTGGGMRCAWTGGFLYGLYEIGIVPQTIVAHSGSLGSVMYFVTGNTESIRRIFTEHLPGNRFISFSRISRIIDIDFLVDTVFKELEPINWTAVHSSPIRVLAPVMSTDGYTTTFSNNDIDFEVLRASKALPFFFRKKVRIHERTYSDYPFTPNELLSVLPTQERSVIVDVRTNNRLVRSAGNLLVRRELKPDESLPKSVVHVIPTLKYHLLTNSKTKLTELFEDGREYAHTNSSLFLA